MFGQFQSLISRSIPELAAVRPELRRRAELIVAFSYLGLVFGIIFAAFYLAIEHFWGAGIISICCILFYAVPHLLRTGVDTNRAGNYYCAIMLAGFVSLGMVEGGIHRHAVAWLVTAPMVAHLLISGRGAYISAVAAFLAVIFFGAAEALGYAPLITYPAKWDALVSIAGYSALAIFLFALGMIFQRGLREAHERMDATLEALAEANGRLTRLNEEKSEFLEIAAHDLKNPLAAVIQCTEALATNELSAERANRTVGSINKEAKRMKRLVSDLLDLHAIEEGRMILAQSSVNLAEELEEVVANLKVDAERKGISFASDIDPNATATGDEQGIAQALENLLSNAIKFSSAGGEVKLDVREDQNEAVMIVRDKGPGISAQDQQKLFERFSRLGARPTAGESSHGLGLSIVKRLVEAMGGKVFCQSAEGKGATFTVRLPKGAPESSSALTREEIQRALAAS